jgi:trans-aconitate methyltransferase
MDYQQVETHFDNLADNYQRIIADQHAFFDKNTSYLQEYKVSLAKELIADPKRILDYGCGIGLLQQFLKAYYPHATITATDISEDSLDHVRTSHPDTFCLSDSEALKTDYDLVVVSCVLHHVPPYDRKSLLERLANSLTPAGRILVFEHNPLNPVTQHMVNTCPIDDDAILLRRSELVRLTNSIPSAKVITSGYTLFFPSVVSGLRRVEKYLRWCPVGGQYFVLIGRDRVNN